MIEFKSKMVEETKKATFLPHGALETIIFIGLFLFSQSITGIFVSIIYVINLIGSGATEFELNMTELGSDMMLPMLFGTISMIILVILYTKVAQKRSLNSIGLGKSHAVKDYMMGYGIGIGMFSAVILLLILTNNLNYVSASLNMWPIVLVFFLGFIIQGASEEVALRGYLMNSLGAKHNLVIAVIVNASIFGVLHATNPGVSLLSIINIILFGVFASIYALKSNNIWGICALHSAWNFVQGNVYGLEVSGMKIEETLWHFKATGNNFINGGAFGPEGGIMTSLVLTISIIIVLFVKTKRNHLE